MSSIPALPASTSGALLAHGGTGGALLEVGFVLVPIAIFAFMAVWTGRKRKREEAEGGQEGQH